MADEGKDGFESREIKYHGKSPDKLLDELKKKNQDRHSQYNRKRRTALILIALSGLVVAGLALISVIYRGQSSETPDYIQTINPFVFKIVSESEYEYGHENNIKVRVSNIERREAGFTFKDFTFSITSERGERVFTFNYPVKTDITMAEYDSRDVYDFRRENPEFMLKPGTYTIHSNFVIDDQQVILTKPVVVFENIDTTINLYHDYILPSQEVPVYLTIENDTPDDQSFILGSYNVYLEETDALANDTEIKGLFVKNEAADGDYQVLQNEKLDILLGRMQFPSNTADYLLKATYFLDDQLNEHQQNIRVNPVSQTKGVRHLRILPYSVKSVGVDEKYTAEILIVNDDDRDVYERVKGFVFEIVKEDATLYRFTKYDDRVLNIFLPAYTKKTLFDSTQWRQISFQEPGICEMKVRVILENGVLEYSEEIIIEK